jgi:hypothetical protein
LPALADLSSTAEAGFAKAGAKLDFAKAGPAIHVFGPPSPTYIFKLPIFAGHHTVLSANVSRPPHEPTARFPILE